MTTTKTTIRVYTVTGANASEVGSRYANECVLWRDAVDRCNSDGTGIVFLDCYSEDELVCLLADLDNDRQVDSYV